MRSERASDGAEKLGEIHAGDESPAATVVLTVDGRLASVRESVELLDGGEQAYPRMLLSIAQAKRSVQLEVYAFAGSGVGAQFVAALGSAASRGVTVEVMQTAGSRRGTASPCQQVGTALPCPISAGLLAGDVELTEGLVDSTIVAAACCRFTNRCGLDHRALHHGVALVRCVGRDDSAAGNETGYTSARPLLGCRILPIDTVARIIRDELDGWSRVNRLGRGQFRRVLILVAPFA